MARKKHDHLVIWPEYFDKSLSRSHGRRVGVRDSLEKPSLDELIAAAKAANLKIVPETNAGYPRFWWKKGGRLLVYTDTPKTQIIQLIANQLERLG